MPHPGCEMWRQGLQHAEEEMVREGGQVLEQALAFAAVQQFQATAPLIWQVKKVAAAGHKVLQEVEEEGSAVARAVVSTGEMLSKEAGAACGCHSG